MNIHCKLVLLVSLLFLISCSELKEEHKDKIRSVDISIQNDLSTKDIFKKIEIIPLETTSESLIISTTKFLFYKNKYFVFDKKQSALFIFNEKGKFINKIQNIGKGPNEYLYLADFDIRKENNTLELLAHNSVLIYDLNGNYIEKYVFSEPIGAVHFFKILSKDKYIFYSIFDNKRIKVYSKLEKKILNHFHEIPLFLSDKTSLNPNKTPFYEQNDSTVNFYDVFSNKVYTVCTNTNDIKLKYEWDFGNYNFDYKSLPTDRDSRYYAKESRSNGLASHFKKNCENERWIFTSFFINKSVRELVYDKSNGVYFNFNMFKEKVYLNDNFLLIDNYCISIIPVGILNLFLNDDCVDEINTSILRNIRIEDNPVIIKYSFK